MNKLHQQRIYFILFIGFSLLLGIGLILYALSQNINAFMTPHEISTAMINKTVRLGGIVKANSVKRSKEDLQVSFIITDNKRDILVNYEGILPDLFREGKGVLAEGRLNTQGIFTATTVLAKHDENYMPKKVYEAMRKEL